MKRDLPTNFRTDDLVAKLSEVTTKYFTNSLLREMKIQNMKKSTAETTFLEFHDIGDIGDYEIDGIGEKFKIKNKKTLKSYVMEVVSDDVMPCTVSDCKIKCSMCETQSDLLSNITVCSHRIICSCPANTYTNMVRIYCYVAKHKTKIHKTSFYCDL